MNLETLQQKLIQAARRDTPDTHVPYAFEQRVMAHLRSSQRLTDPWYSWSQSLVKAIVPCFGLFLAIAAWNWNQSSRTDDPRSWAGGADELEVAVVDAIDTPDAMEDAW